eukprot:260984_1
MGICSAKDDSDEALLPKNTEDKAPEKKDVEEQDVPTQVNEPKNEDIKQQTDASDKPKSDKENENVSADNAPEIQENENKNDNLEAFNAKEYVNKTISSGSIVVISKSECPDCKEALTILQKYSENIIKKDIDLDFEESNVQQIRNYCKELTGDSSVPRVFIDGKFIGGSDDIKGLDEKGELKTLIENATKVTKEE